MARQQNRTGPPLWLGLLILVVAPFVVLAAVLTRAPTLGTPAGAFMLYSGQTYVSTGNRLVLYLPGGQSHRSCWLFDENDRALQTDPTPDSLQTEVGREAYKAVLAYRAEPGAVISVSCDLDPSTPLLLSPPISRQSAILPIAVGGALGFFMIGCGSVMLFSRKRARAAARLDTRFGS